MLIGADAGAAGHKGFGGRDIPAVVMAVDAIAFDGEERAMQTWRHIRFN